MAEAVGFRWIVKDSAGGPLPSTLLDTKHEDGSVLKEVEITPTTTQVDTGMNVTNLADMAVTIDDIQAIGNTRVKGITLVAPVTIAPKATQRVALKVLFNALSIGMVAEASVKPLGKVA